MRIIGCDLHAAQQTIAMLDRESGEIVERTLTHEGTTVNGLDRHVARRPLRRSTRRLVDNLARPMASSLPRPAECRSLPHICVSTT
jgi:hypothetical protein